MILDNLRLFLGLYVRPKTSLAGLVDRGNIVFSLLLVTAVVLESRPEGVPPGSAAAEVLATDVGALRRLVDTATPADVVQRQLNAYNARDLDAFIAAYHPDARLYDFPDTPLMQGHDAMRARYGGMFSRLTALHAQVPRRIVSFVLPRHEREGRSFGPKATM